MSLIAVDCHWLRSIIIGNSLLSRRLFSINHLSIIPSILTALVLHVVVFYCLGLLHGKYVSNYFDHLPGWSKRVSWMPFCRWNWRAIRRSEEERRSWQCPEGDLWLQSTGSPPNAFLFYLPKNMEINNNRWQSMTIKKHKLFGHRLVIDFWYQSITCNCYRLISIVIDYRLWCPHHIVSLTRHLLCPTLPRELNVLRRVLE